MLADTVSTSARHRAPQLLRTRPHAWPLPAQLIAALALALLPIGILALLAAYENYGQFRDSGDRLAQTRLAVLRQSVATRLDGDVRALRELARTDMDAATCRTRIAQTLRAAPTLSLIARVDASGGVQCAAGSGPPPTSAPLRLALRRGPDVRGLVNVALAREPATGDLLLIVRDNGPLASGEAMVARAPVDRLETLVDRGLLGPQDTLILTLRGERVRSWGEDGSAERSFFAPITAASASAPLDAELGLELRVPRPPLSLAQALSVALPALMLLTAIGIGWIAINRIAVRPLRRMQGAIERYSAGDREARLMPLALGSPELADFGAAFDTMADRIAGHATEMDAALAKQTALTREVHHRVKNNLQIVSSLLSLQARDATSVDVKEAYALIRGRVNALALVHRWMYQDDAAQGVDLRALVADLCANLEHGFEGQVARAVRVVAAVDRLHVNQDTALPVAFLVTELVSGAIRSDGVDQLDIAVAARAEGTGARLTVTCALFARAEGLALFDDASARILVGLSRQLRSTLAHEPEAERFAISFPVLRPA